MVREERLRIILHPTCPSSRSLIYALAEKGLLGELPVIVLDEPKQLPPGVYPWSVPMLLDSDGTPLAMDPIEADEVEAYLEGESYDVGDEVEYFKKSIFYSNYASALTLVHRGIKPLLQGSFLYPALRLKPRGRDPVEAKRLVEKEADRIYLEVRGVAARVVSAAIVRFYYYSGLRDSARLSGLDERDVSTLILAMASVGRIHLPVKPVELDMVGFIAGFVSRNAAGLLKKIEGEYEETVLDEDYQRLISQLSAAPHGSLV